VPSTIVRLACSPFHDAANGSQQHRHDLTTFGTLCHDSPQDLKRFPWLELPHQYRYFAALLSPEVELLFAFTARHFRFSCHFCRTPQSTDTPSGSTPQ
jgi:hypothetical protein